MQKFLAFFCLGLLAFFPFAMAEMSHEAHNKTAATDIYAPAMEKMHKDMMITPSGDADVDFVRGMIPHHQGAIDMAKILKEHGDDPKLQELADDIIIAQEKEIKFMQKWLEKHEAEKAKKESAKK